MYRIPDATCEKCGGGTSIHWDNGEKSSGMDIKPLRPSGMIRTCGRCGYSRHIDSLDENKIDA